MLIGLGIVILSLVVWRVWAGHVDRANPHAVATAFVKALKGENLGRASGFWVPDGADAWRSGAEARLESMQSGTHTRFFEDLPASPIFTVRPRALKQPTNEQTMVADGATVDLRQIDGKWYVCKAPI